jgi:hypothetical protein
MTREEKIICKTYLNDLDRTHDCNEYKLLMALLDREPSEDCVSRRAVFETIDDCNSDGLKGIFCSYNDGKRFEEYIKNLPSVTPIPKGYGRLIDVGQCDRKLFYQQCGGEDSLITVKSAFDMLMALPTIIDADKENKE